MTNKPILIEVPTYQPITEYKPGVIKWCEAHWSELMFALQDRGVADQIAQDDESLNRKLEAGEGDPCWEAFTAVNVGAISIFGAPKIVEEYGGCPACAFNHVVQHAADLVTLKHLEPH